jgi:hypothetical protein
MGHLALREYPPSPGLDSVAALCRGGDASTPTVSTPQRFTTFATTEARAIPRKLFIVARSNTAAYQQLLRTVGREPGVEIIYDRRFTSRLPGTLRRLASRLKRALGVGGPRGLKATGRRRRPYVDQELKANGWAVVRLDEPPRTGRSSSSPLS